jgi:hypothetical protein
MVLESGESLLLRRFAGFRVLPAEALHAAGGIDQLLLAREIGMAVRANFYRDIALVGRAGHKSIAARAMHAYFVISGMNSCLHMGSDLDANL